MATNITTKRYPSIIGGVLVVLAFISVVMVVPAEANSTQIYFLRHAEIDKKNLDKPLTAKGRERAAALVEYFEGIKITYIYASHTDRTRDTVLPLAKAQGLKVQQLPIPGSNIGGEVVNNRSKGKGKVAIKPLIDELKKVPEGSTVVVGGNSGNLYAVMAGLGVRFCTKGKPCGEQETSCLPCNDKSCFPKKEFHNIWKVTLSDKDATMSNSHYGEVPTKTKK
jgi:hypothetical protein